MLKTLILNLGQANTPATPPAGMAHLEIDGVPTADVRCVTVEIDATDGEPAHFHLERCQLSADGKLWESGEAHLISNISMIIEYQEA